MAFLHLSGLLPLLLVVFLTSFLAAEVSAAAPAAPAAASPPRTVDCWQNCGRSGPCGWCDKVGFVGKCCRKHFNGGEKGCLPEEGGTGHVCVAAEAGSGWDAVADFTPTPAPAQAPAGAFAGLVAETNERQAVPQVITPAGGVPGMAITGKGAMNFLMGQMPAVEGGDSHQDGGDKVDIGVFLQERRGLERQGEGQGQGQRRQALRAVSSESKDVPPGAFPPAGRPAADSAASPLHALMDGNFASSFRMQVRRRQGVFRGSRERERERERVD